MTTTANEVQSAMDAYTGGSERRFRHALNPDFIYTEGMKAVADTAQAYWLLDEIALALAPAYARAWLAGSASIGEVRLQVGSDGSATLTLTLDAGPPPTVRTRIAQTDFPAGDWLFYLGTDEVGDELYVTNCMVPPEY